MSKGLVKKCPTCKRRFSIDLHKQDRTQKFCSRKCVRNSSQFKKGFSNRKGAKHSKESIQKMVVHPNRPKFVKGHTINTGRAPWNKGLEYGVTERFRSKIMNLSIYRNWRIAIKDRDGRECTNCGDTQLLEVDHFPKTFAQIIRENNIETLSQAKECIELWQLENGRTLCRECHKKTKTYGKGL